MLDFVKTYLRIDGVSEDSFLTTLVNIAKTYIQEATGVSVDDTNEVHLLTVAILVTHWYENRLPVGKVDDLSFSLRSLLTQIEYKASDSL